MGAFKALLSCHINFGLNYFNFFSCIGLHTVNQKRYDTGTGTGETVPVVSYLRITSTGETVPVVSLTVLRYL